jgi:hypothetical protein
MNWKVLKPKTPIWFKKGEPICMILPYPVALLEQCRTRQESIEGEPALFQAFLKWRETRTQQHRDLEAGKDPAMTFKLDYVRGANPDGTFAGSHWSKLKLGRFEG